MEQLAPEELVGQSSSSDELDTFFSSCGRRFGSQRVLSNHQRSCVTNNSSTEHSGDIGVLDMIQDEEIAYDGGDVWSGQEQVQHVALDSSKLNEWDTDSSASAQDQANRSRETSDSSDGENTLTNPIEGVTNVSKIDLTVTSLQYKAAMYILTSGPHSSGLMKKQTEEYLSSLQRDGEVRTRWPSSHLFWTDYKKREVKCLSGAGKWKIISIQPPSSRFQCYTLFVRSLRETIQHVIATSRILFWKTETDWNNHLHLEPYIKVDESGNRIVDSIQSADDAYISLRSYSMLKNDANMQLLPYQLFVDKGNVTRLNKRSMYPVVLYLLCLSRTVRRILAVNVSFIPIVTDREVFGRPIPTANCVTTGDENTALGNGR